MNWITANVIPDDVICNGQVANVMSTCQPNSLPATDKDCQYTQLSLKYYSARKMMNGCHIMQDILAKYQLMIRSAQSVITSLLINIIILYMIDATIPQMA